MPCGAAEAGRYSRIHAALSINPRPAVSEQPWPSLVGVESLAEVFDELIRILIVEDLIPTVAVLYPSSLATVQYAGSMMSTPVFAIDLHVSTNMGR